MRIALFLLGIAIIGYSIYWPSKTTTEKPSVFMTRVVPFTDSASYYEVQYTTDGHRWNSINSAMMISGRDPRDWHTNAPMLLESFDLAIQQAKTFKSIADVDLHHAKEKERYDSKHKEAMKYFDERRNKTWVSEPIQ